MRGILLAVYGLTVFPFAGWAQETAVDPMAYSLPSGQVLHFESLEQKARFIAARERSAAAVTATPAASPTPEIHAPAGEHAGGAGTVNKGAPTFSADYYLLAPETWLDKPLTLSVAYLKAPNEVPRDDGLRMLTAHTYGVLHGNGETYPGGTISILATPAAAERITRMCGSTLQYGGGGVRTKFIKGKLILIEPTGRGKKKKYGVFVEQ